MNKSKEPSPKYTAFILIHIHSQSVSVSFTLSLSTDTLTWLVSCILIRTDLGYNSDNKKYEVKAAHNYIPECCK